MTTLLCILDGVGIRKEIKGNAVKQANMPNFNYLLQNYPNSLLEASGKLVGLPEGQMGNSEVGHMNIGAGRIVYQSLELINSKIEDKTFFQTKEILSIMEYVNKNDSSLHLMGLLSDGGIHSSIEHLFALIKMAKEENIKKLYIHPFLDGRDTLPKVALKYLDELDSKLKEYQIGSIASLSGRYYSMDRDNRYDRVKKSYDMLTKGLGETYDNYKEAIESNYQRGIEDEFIEPAIIDENGIIKDNDGIIVFNYRSDRIRELPSALSNDNFNGFNKENLKNIKLLTMMPVSEEVVGTHAFKLPDLKNTFGEYISNLGYTQLRIAETEKYAHVTYFFDGGIEKNLKGCDRILVKSPDVPTYDLKPEMSVYKVTEKLLENIERYDFVILNFANGDMVGHTGNINATIKALEAVDECLGKIIKKTEEINGNLFVTADHGNSDYMLDENNNVVTSHSTALVPLIIMKENIKLKKGKLGDIAPTMLSINKIAIPEEMTGENLVDKEI
ncbi:MAG: 2,3-bisphosphoglycerate-independent phosphoglycerate mutase [Bacilli bacterium]|nr:2,3-bisphosphoglycerate-independent phosphoglycerate mutase [Bacilli bacterium]